MLVSVALMLVGLAGVSLGQEPLPEQPPDNVAGNWTIYAKDPDGSTSTKYVQIKQNGTH
jgi:hypothetical protein